MSTLPYDPPKALGGPSYIEKPPAPAPAKDPAPAPAKDPSKGEPGGASEPPGDPPLKGG